jgi:hypothetical protein
MLKLHLKLAAGDATHYFFDIKKPAFAVAFKDW